MSSIFVCLFRCTYRKKAEIFECTFLVLTNVYMYSKLLSRYRSLLSPEELPSCLRCHQNSHPAIQRQISFFFGGGWLVNFVSLEFHINEITQNIHVCVSVLLKSMFFRFYIYIKYCWIYQKFIPFYH